MKRVTREYAAGQIVLLTATGHGRQSQDRHLTLAET
jgi:hypothetical protein